MATMAACGNRYSDEIQHFPQAWGPINLDLTALRKVVPPETKDVYCYVIDTIKYRDSRFIQTGTAPNFQGGLITLCTCKHQMRSGLDVNSWPGQWIAGFTGKNAVEHGNGHYLVYLMKVSEALASHQELWWSKAVSAEAKQAKAAHLHRGGDMYEPRSPSSNPFDHRSYVAPCDDHDHAKINKRTKVPFWYEDVNYAGYGGKQPPLLVGDTRLSFLWDRPVMRFPLSSPRNPRRPTLRDLLGQLEAIN